MSSFNGIEALNCTESEFTDAFRAQGFLSPYIDDAVRFYVAEHREWFEHAEALNKEGLAVYARRDNSVVGFTSLDVTPLAVRMAYRALSTFQGALILYRRGMRAEGDTLARGVYETAFWIGFLLAEPERGKRAFLNDELRSQRDQAKYFLDQFKRGERSYNSAIEAQLRARVAELSGMIDKADVVSVKDAAKAADLYGYYEAYKHLSASSAHNSVHSLHRYLNRNPDGSYNGLVVGPDIEGLADALSVLCVGLGITLAMFCTLVHHEDEEAALKALLIKTDALRRPSGSQDTD